MTKKIAIAFLCLLAPFALAQQPPPEEPPQSDLIVSKSGPSEAAAGSDVTYTVTVRNAGPIDSAAVTLNDPIPAGMTFVSSSQSASSFTPCSTPAVGATGTVTCTSPSMPANEVATFTFVFNIDSKAEPGTYFTNVATASTSTDSFEENNSGVAVTSTPPPPSADLSVTKTGPSSATYDADITYTITAVNNGPSTATNVVLRDFLPGSTSYVSLIQNSGPTMVCAGPDGGVIQCTADTLPPFATVTFTLTVHGPAEANAGSTVQNTVTIRGDQDPNDENNTSSVVTTLSSADVFIQKSGPATANAGTDVAYQIRVENNGPDSAINVGFSDPLPANTTFVSLTYNSGQVGTCTTSPVVCTFDALGIGQFSQYTVVFRVGDTTLVTNTATASSDSADPNLNNNQATVTTVITPIADLAVTKSGPATINAGAQITYNVGVTNNGPSTATSVVLSDPLPAGTSFVSATQLTGPTFVCGSSAGTITCTRSSFAPLASATFSFVLNVSPDAVSPVTNVAHVASATSDPTPTNNDATATTSLTQLADVAVTKIGPGAVVAGNQVTYTVGITNNGPSNALNVVLTDTLPAGTTFVSATQNTGPLFACAQVSGTITCTRASFGPSLPATFSFVITVPIGTLGPLTNTASATTTTTDSVPTNNAATATTTVSTAPADLSITKTVDTPSNLTGANVVYTITVANAGPGPAIGVVVTDPLPAGTTLVSATSTDASCSGTTTVTCTIATLNAGSTATIRLVVTLPTTAQAVTNTATVTSDTPDSNSTNNSGAVTVNAVLPAPPIPTLSPLFLALLALGLGAIVVLRRT